MRLPDFDTNDYIVLKQYISQMPPDQQKLLNKAVDSLSTHMRNIGSVNGLFLVYYIGRFMNKKEEEAQHNKSLLQHRNAITQADRR